MKGGLILSSSAFAGSGLFAGNIAFDKFFEPTIESVLKMQQISILSTTGEDESWLILAQQYRENGTVRRISDRNFSIQKNPEFLSEKIWNSHAKGNSGFSKDKEIAIELQKACTESLGEKYSDKLYDQVLRWCTLDLPQYVKDILKIQKNNGDCRFWLIKSKDNNTGWFVWEVLNDIKPNQKNNHLITLKRDLESDSGKAILEGCKTKQHGYLELSTRNGVWQISPDWNSKNVHKLPFTSEQLGTWLKKQSSKQK